MVEEIVMVMYPKVCEKLNYKVPVDIQAIPSYEYDVGLALCKHVGGNKYQIHYNPQCPDLVLMICHELVHIVQHLRGDIFKYDLPYKEQIHEIEAYALEQELADTYYTLTS